MECLIVPMELEALCLNETLLGRDGVRWWEYNYAALNRFLSPEPTAFDAAVRWTKAGVYLHFVLPRALRTSIYEDGSFPMIPNRWLITRTNQQDGSVRSWVLESDCPVSDLTMEQEGTGSVYPVDGDILTGWQNSADPYRRQAHINGGTSDAPVCYAEIGISFALEDWKEREPEQMFLTALAPGNEIFTAYYPHNRRVLSFYDDLQGIDCASLTYDVIGWYSNTDKDVLRPNAYVQADGLEQVLEQLNWKVESIPEEACSVYCGRIQGIPWDRNGEVPPGDPLTALAETQKINMALGSQPLDALTAIAAMKTEDEREQKRLVQFMEALYLDRLEELDHPAGEQVLRNSMRQNSFEKYTGDTVWRIVKEKKEGEEIPLTEEEQTLVNKLNETQRQYDELMRKLHSIQWELNAVWWKYGRLSNIKINHTGITKEELQPLLQPDGLVLQAEGLVKEMNRLAAMLPETSGDPEEQQKKFQMFLQQNGCTDGILKAGTQNDFYLPENPAILINGLSVTPDLVQETQENLLRLSDHPAGENIPGMDKLPIYVAQTAALAGNLPDIGRDAWKQPYAPMFCEWNLQYTHIPWIQNGRENWYFDGEDYRLRPGAGQSPGDSAGYGGISTLSPHINTIMHEKLMKLSVENDYGKQVAEWQFLTQGLNHFQEQLAQRDNRAFRRPVQETYVSQDGVERYLDDLLGYPQSGPQMEGSLQMPGQAQNTIDSIPFARNDVVPPYFGMQSGKITFQNIMLYDKFGRVLNLISDEEGAGLHLADNFPLVLSDTMMENSAQNQRLDTQAILAPRLLQPARLRLENRGGAEVCGWVTVNYADHSLVVYESGSPALGELLLLASQQGKKVCFRKYYGMENRKLQNDTMKKLVASCMQLGEQDWNQFLGTLERTLWSLPPSNSSETMFFTGRLLAVVQMELALELMGEPYKDQDWKMTTVSQRPDYLDFKFRVRLGDRKLPEDGLAGYYPDDFSTFNSIVEPIEGGNYVRQIGPAGSMDGNYVELSIGEKQEIVVIAVPELYVHAYSGILPVTRAGISGAFPTKEEVILSVGPLRIGNDDQRIIGGVTRAVQGYGNNYKVSWRETDREEKAREYPVDRNQAEGRVWSVREGYLAVEKEENENE